MICWGRSMAQGLAAKAPPSAAPFCPPSGRHPPIPGTCCLKGPEGRSHPPSPSTSQTCGSWLECPSGRGPGELGPPSLRLSLDSNWCPCCPWWGRGAPVLLQRAQQTPPPHHRSARWQLSPPAASPVDLEGGWPCPAQPVFCLTTVRCGGECVIPSTGRGEAQCDAGQQDGERVCSG